MSQKQPEHPRRRLEGTGLEVSRIDMEEVVYILITFPIDFSQDAILQNRELWLLIKKKFGFYSKSQYRTWQKKLAEDSTWPPTKGTDYSGDGKNGFYINMGYESSENIPKEDLEREGQTIEQHFWTRL